ncbi:MAG: Glu-tRNA(Gln) amidotransferase subunit GatD [Methanomassiliicoccales archaeon]|nr:MAG: Glu-tRNA(Gln) amidotransferase subunit GatD [Methanomassiliicoccales archaeon]
MSYSKMAIVLLQAAKAEEGDLIEVTSDGRTYQGILMPHHEFSGEDVIVIKQKSGYNIGVRLKMGATIKVLAKKEEKVKPSRHFVMDPALRTVSVLGTGGTIASFVDYRTGAVHPALSADDLISAVPEISEICNVKAKVLFSIFSENMDPEAWRAIARAVFNELKDGSDAVIIPHGTDTLAYTSAALSFMLEGLDRPVVLVGAQRSSDRPSSDSYTNLISAARFCIETAMPGVYVLMHGSISDTTAFVHKGTRVRKMHSSRRDAFKSINDSPVATVFFDGKIEVRHAPSVKGGGLVLKDSIERSVVLLQFYPGMDPAAFKQLMLSHKGVVIAGSGLGHVSSAMVNVLGEVVSKGVPVFMTTQCLGGSVNLNVYATGRDLINAGVVPLGDMLPETATVKLMWALGQTSSPEAVRELMTTDLRGEMSQRRGIDG